MNILRHTGLPLICLIACVAAPIPVHALQAEDKSLVVTITAGQIKGAPHSGGGAEFLGVPYAQPPIGDLRWHEPLPAKPWTGVRSATTFGAPCSQPNLGDWNRRDAERGKEDCLF